MKHPRSSLVLLLSTLVFTGASLVSGCSTRHEDTPVEYVSSSAITFKVKEGLLRDSSIKSYGIRVDTYKDTVTLSGHVQNSAQEERAIEIARNVKGVKYVVDNLTVGQK